MIYNVMYRYHDVGFIMREATFAEIQFLDRGHQYLSETEIRAREEQIRRADKYV